VIAIEPLHCFEREADAGRQEGQQQQNEELHTAQLLLAESWLGETLAFSPADTAAVAEVQRRQT
jgi:hypothetical protein